MDVNHAALQALRERSGYSIRGLAKASGVSKTTISVLELGERKSSHPSTIKKLADALAVPVPALVRQQEVA